MAGLFSLYFVVGLASCTQGGFYYFQLLDRYAAGYSILIAVFFEAIAVSWIYGTNRFCEDIRDMIGITPGIYWRVCWRFAAPIFLLFIIIYGLATSQPLSYENYVYPTWANALGWCIAGSSMIMIPGVAIVKLLMTPGTIKQVSWKIYSQKYLLDEKQVMVEKTSSFSIAFQTSPLGPLSAFFLYFIAFKSLHP